MRMMGLDSVRVLEYYKINAIDEGRRVVAYGLQRACGCCEHAEVCHESSLHRSVLN